jgi:hypothetical protein
MVALQTTVCRIRNNSNCGKAPERQNVTRTR